MMAVYTREINTNFNYPNIDIINVLRDGVQTRYEAVPHEGYVMYNANANDKEYAVDPETGDILTDPETGELIEVPVIYYYTLAGFPLNYNFNNFPWIAVLRSEVDENYIFGGGDNDHEVM